MLHHALVYLLTTLLVCPAPAVRGLFEWMRRSETGSPPAAAPPPASVAPTLLAKEAQFEMVTADEKFLAEAKQMEISPLDSCHYRVCLSIHLKLTQIELQLRIMNNGEGGGCYTSPGTLTHFQHAS